VTSGLAGDRVVIDSTRATRSDTPFSERAFPSAFELVTVERFSRLTTSAAGCKVFHVDCHAPSEIPCEPVENLWLSRFEPLQSLLDLSIWPPTRIRSVRCLVRRYVIAICLLLLCGGVCWFHGARYAGEPSYQGKGLGQWLDAASGRHTHWRPGKEATDHAVLMMGTNTVPLLLNRLSSAGPDPPSEFKRKIAAWLARRGFKAHAMRFYDPYGQERLFAILGAWVALRPVADKIVPILIALYNEETPFNPNAFIALGRLGPAAKTAIPFLLDETHSTQAEARAAAVSTLGTLRSDAELVVPRLILCLGDPDSRVRGLAASALAQFEEEPNMRSSALHSSLQEVPLALRGTSKSSDCRVEPDAVEQAVQHVPGDRTKLGAERHTRDQVSLDRVSDEVRKQER
jgi:hypothetical protein